MKSWKAAVNGVVAATARSTCAFPRTSRRVRIPVARRSSSVLGTVGSFTWYLPCRWRDRRARGGPRGGAGGGGGGGGLGGPPPRGRGPPRPEAAPGGGRPPRPHRGPAAAG